MQVPLNPVSPYMSVLHCLVALVDVSAVPPPLMTSKRIDPRLLDSPLSVPPLQWARVLLNGTQMVPLSLLLSYIRMLAVVLLILEVGPKPMAIAAIVVREFVNGIFVRRRRLSMPITAVFIPVAHLPLPMLLP